MPEVTWQVSGQNEMQAQVCDKAILPSIPESCYYSTFVFNTRLASVEWG